MSDREKIFPAPLAVNTDTGFIRSDGKVRYRLKEGEEVVYRGETTAPKDNVVVLKNGFIAIRLRETHTPKP